MFLNHARKPVWEWLKADRTLSDEPSYCPDCKSLLVAVRGDSTIHHWRHLASARDPNCRMGGESAWHLAMKDYAQTVGYELEYVADQFRFDALWTDMETKPRHSIIEFIGSLSDGYTVKAATLYVAGLSGEVAWVFNAENFVSARLKPRRKGGIANLLKPAAYDQVADLHQTGQAVFVDHGDGYVHWKDNVWFPVTDRRMGDLLRRGRPPLPPRPRTDPSTIADPRVRAEMERLARRFGIE